MLEVRIFYLFLYKRLRKACNAVFAGFGERVRTNCVHLKTTTYVYRQQLRPRSAFLLHHDDVLGIVGQHPEAGFEELALRTFLLGLRHRHGALYARRGVHHGQHRLRGAFVPARFGAGRCARRGERRAGRRDLQRLEHPALGVGGHGGAVGRLSAGCRTGTGAGCRRQLRGCAQRRSRHPVSGRGADRCGDRLQRHRLAAGAERRYAACAVPQGRRAGGRGRRADVRSSTASSRLRWIWTISRIRRRAC